MTILTDTAPPATATATGPALAAGRSPGARAWARFRRHRLGWWSLWIFGVLLVLATAAELVSNDKPFVARIDGRWWFPVIDNPSERAIGGDFATPTDWKDPWAQARLAAPGNWALHAPNPHSATSTDYFSPQPSPTPPSARNWLGTDPQGRDIAAQLLYGFRVSIWFGLALTAIGTLLGVAAGAVMGYFGGRTDLLMQRGIEIWGAVPELYLLIIFAAIFQPSLGLLLVLLSLWGWMGLSDYVRGEFLRVRALDHVKAARALGLGPAAIIWRHVLPNAMTPVITFIPFRMSGAILALTSLDFLGLGVPPDVPSLGLLLQQGKANLDAWWIIVPTFVLLALTMLLLTFIGDALRDAFDTRKG
ncbi:MAG: hypothetical protein RLY78_3716 [Pseudomonadota bacterium]|jgi:microcin C transport system permease protein